MGIEARLANLSHGTEGAIFMADETYPPFKVSEKTESIPLEISPQKQKPAAPTTKWPIHGTSGSIFSE